MKTFRTDLRVGDALTIDEGRVTIRLEEKSGQRARLSFMMEDDVRIGRQAAPQAGADQAKLGLRM